MIDPAQEDVDGDGVGDRCDCAPWETARRGLEEVASLRWEQDKTQLGWDGVSGADRYDLQRGDLPALSSGIYGSCLADDIEGFSWTDAAPPPAGSGYFYLVRGDDHVCGAGSFGRASGGQSRDDPSAGSCAAGGP